MSINKAGTKKSIAGAIINFRHFSKYLVKTGKKPYFELNTIVNDVKAQLIS